MQVQLTRARASQLANLVVASDGQNLPAGDGDGLRVAEFRVYGDNFSVEQNRLRLGLRRKMVTKNSWVRIRKKRGNINTNE